MAEVGQGVSGWPVGDPCVALLAGGGYAEYVVAPAGQVVPPPPGMDLVAAAGAIEVAATVSSNLELARLSGMRSSWFTVAPEASDRSPSSTPRRSARR